MTHRRERTVILAALFIAMSVGLGFLLAGIPNFELMTLTIFMAGIFCGARLGAAIGAFSSLIFSLLNQFGPAPAPLLAAQIAGFAVIGLGGGLIGPRLAPESASSVFASAVAGLVLTFVYDVLTTIATAFIALGASRFIEGLGGIAVAGIAFVVWHMGVNAAVFAVAVPPLMKTVRAWQGGETA